MCLLFIPLFSSTISGLKKLQLNLMLLVTVKKDSSILILLLTIVFGHLLQIVRIKEYRLFSAKVRVVTQFDLKWHWSWSYEFKNLFKPKKDKADSCESSNDVDLKTMLLAVILSPSPFTVVPRTWKDLSFLFFFVLSSSLNGMIWPRIHELDNCDWYSQQQF